MHIVFEDITSLCLLLKFVNLKKSSHQWLHFLHKINKKYEYRTGPFEGFFVSSVEFCKFNKFDDKDRKGIRYNRTGTQGPTRAHLALRVHQVHNASQLGTVEASCDLEDIAISGGAEHFFPRNSHIILFGDFPSTSSNSTWDGQIQFDGTVKQELYMQNVLIILH